MAEVLDYLKELGTFAWSTNQDDRKKVLAYGSLAVVGVVASAVLVDIYCKNRLQQDQKNGNRGNNIYATRHAVNLHKILIFPKVLFLMHQFNKYTERMYLYLALHSTYGVLWCLKDYLYPDRNFSKNNQYFISLVSNYFDLEICYSFIPHILALFNPQKMKNHEKAIAISLWGFGLFFQFAGDCQKYYTLKYKKGLIKDGFFKLLRHPGYFGEFLIYSAYAYTSGHGLSAISIYGLMLPVLYQLSVDKEKSLSRYHDWQDYVTNTPAYIPNLLKLAS